ncbi:unnamed protein product [Paramecium pentaurelia]|uniref:UDENN domain-containing protein n=1 Tax=Paramecium pentaurelia TaxID=43138 RepID=A0A8S1XU28_9CILI|nr:unnamed protein product [Paramecium pentaurelia]
MQQNQENAQNLILNYCLVGLGEKLIPMMKNQRRLLTSIQLNEKKCKTLFNEQNIILQESLDILGNEKLFLLCIYNEPNKDPITNIAFINVEVRESQIQFKYKYSLCPIMKQADVMKSIQITDWGLIKDQERFDISPYLSEQNICYVLCYTRKTDYVPIINLVLEDYDPNHDLQDIVQFSSFSKKQLSIIRQKPPLEQTYTPEILDLYPFCYKESQKQKHNQNLFNDNPSISNYCIPEGIQILQKTPNQLPNQNQITYYQLMQSPKGDLIYIYCLRYYEPLTKKQAQKLKLDNYTNLFIPKVMAIISYQNFSSQFSSLLTYLYSIRDDSQIEQYIERVIQQLKYSINLEKISLKLILNDQQFLFQKHIKYPTCQLKSIEYVMRNITVDNIIQLYTAVLTERKIRLCSSSILNPGYVIEALMTFIYPLQYQKLLICYLNYDNSQIIETPEPYIVGLLETLPQPACESEGYKFILDYNVAFHVCPPPEFPLFDKLKKKLEPFFKQDINEANANMIKEIFLKINMKILDHAFDYDIKQKNWSIAFQKRKQSQYPIKGQFWEIFSRTQLLCSFIDNNQSNRQLTSYITYFNASFQQVNENNNTKIFADIKTININDQNNSQIQTRNKQSFFPYLTPYYYIRNKQTALQTQVYRIWLQIIHMTQLDSKEFYELAIYLKKEIPIIQDFIQQKEHVQLHQYDDLNDKQFQFLNECPYCKRLISIEEILHKIVPTYLRQTIKCSKKKGCGNQFTPKMTIDDVGELDILNIHQLHFQLDQLKVFDQKFYKTTEFWNLIFYFRLFKLPIPFINESEEASYCFKQKESKQKGVKVCLNDNLKALQIKKVVQTKQIIYGESASRK